MKKFLSCLFICLLFSFTLVYAQDSVEDTLSSKSWSIQNKTDLVRFKASKANFAVDARTSGANIYDLHVIDKNENKMLTNINCSTIYDIDVRGNLAEITPLYGGEHNIYSVTTGKVIVKGYFKQPNAYNTDDVCYKIYMPFYTDSGCGLINTATGSIVIQPIYKDMGVFYNDLAIALKKDGSYAIINIEGNEIKNFRLDGSWQFVYSKGTNMIMSDNKGQFLYRAYSEIKSPYYSYCSFADYEIIAHKDYHYYILDSECKVKMDCAGYDSVQYLGRGMYKAHKINGPYVYDIVNPNNKVILNGIDGHTDVDEKGFLLYSKGTDNPEIFVYDPEGNIVGYHKFTSYLATGYMATNVPDAYFVNENIYVGNLKNNKTDKYTEIYMSLGGEIIKEEEK